MLTRRSFVLGAAATGLAAPAILRAQSLWRNYPFSLGVAAGDPAPNGFVIWTRLAPEPLAPDGGMGIGIAPVKWEVAADDRFQNVVRSGEALARPELAHSVHVEVDGLQPDRPYWYRFEVQGERSIRGRARTLPVATATPQALRFGIAGCQHYEDGYYTAYRHLAREDVAFVFHYGDYIYEYGGDAIRPSFGGDIIVPVRQHASRGLFDIEDYRQRYAQTRMDADLQRAHAAHAFFVTLDDHEVENNWVANQPQTQVPSDIFHLRRQQAFQAWYEHMPVRRSALPRAGGMAMHRSARFGDLARLDFLDTRQFRTNQPCGDGFKPACPEVRAQTAAVLGAEQEEWLARNHQRQPARWNVLAQQIMMMSLDRRRNPQEGAEKVLNLDSWAGYEVPRQRLLNRLRGLPNTIVLTGDEHQNFAGLLHDEGGRAVGAEFVSTSISSGGDGQDMRPGTDFILRNNADTLKFVNSQRGYLTCEVTPESWSTHYMVMDRVTTPGGQISRRATATVPAGAVELSVS